VKKSQKLAALAELTARGLNTPKVLDLIQLKALHPSDEVYLRGRKSDPRLNRRMTVDEALVTITQISGEADQSELPIIEANPPPEISGVMYVAADRRAYIELVIGHLSTLLHRGECLTRVHLDTMRRSAKIIHCKQSTIVRQTVKGLEASPNELKPNAEQLRITLRSLCRAHAMCSPCEMLEWFQSPDGSLVFIDLKQSVRNSDYLELFKETISAGKASQRTSLEWCTFGNFQQGYADLPHTPFYSIVRDEALLSHFFTTRCQIPKVIEFQSVPTPETMLI
jgi:hypothetical protein